MVLMKIQNPAESFLLKERAHILFIKG